MFPSSPPRPPAHSLALSSPYIPPSYEFPGYHHVADPCSTSAWNPVYASREEYPYSFPASNPSGGQVCFTAPELSGGGGSLSTYGLVPGQDPYSSKRRTLEPLRPPGTAGKTRTKDKYRVVYTDHQRLELEKEFQYNRYITMRRKTELSMALNLSERQVKIWFQNRRAKERKMNRKKLQHSQQASTTTPTPPVLSGPTDPHLTTSPSTNILSDAISEEY